MAKSIEMTSVPSTVGAAEEEYEVIVSLNSDVGCQRELNEDAVRYVTPNDAKRRASRGILAVIADGMGGHSAGEVASQMAVEIVSRRYYEPGSDARAALEQAFHQANRDIRQAAQRNPALAGMGTTCTALVLCNGMALCAQVGDSRLYLVRDDNIYLMSEDHSAVMQLVKHGVLSRAAADHHPDKNVLLHAMGTSPELRVSIWDSPFPIRTGDNFVLCSDGLYDLVSDTEIKQIVLTSDPFSATETLITLAKARGGYDNISVGVLRIRATAEVSDEELQDTREMVAIGFKEDK